MNISRFLLIFTLIFLPILSFSQNQEIIGNWVFEDEGEEGLFTFDKKSFAYFTLEGETIGGPSYFIDEEEYALRYVIDNSKSPNLIDFIIFNTIDGSVFDTMKGIYQLSTNRSKMLLCMNFEGGKRPTSFEEEDTVELTKIK